jgi:hypothetical protein
MWHLAETLRGLRRSDGPATGAPPADWQASFGPDHEWTAWT